MRHVSFPDIHKRQLKKIEASIEEEAKQFGKEAEDKIVTLLTAAFGFVAALAWNEAVKATFQKYYPESGTGLAAKFIYATFVTILGVFVIYWIAKVNRARKAEKEKK